VLSLVLALLLITPDELPALRARLDGISFHVSDDERSLWIDDVAGEGAPRIGVVARVGRDLVLVTDDGQWRLTGPLARPRIAGPGYTVWVIGDIMPPKGGGPSTSSGQALRIRRIGVLRRPS
jgi:hypothetical protein